MISLTFVDNIDGTTYVHLKRDCIRLIELPHFDILLSPDNHVYVLSYIGKDFYARQILSTTSTTELGEIEPLLPVHRDPPIYQRPRVAESTQVLETEALRDALQDAGILSKRRKGKKSAGRKLLERITPSWYDTTEEPK
jgi:hypothetical protein